MIEVPEHLPLIEGVNLPTILEDCQCTVSCDDERPDVLMIQKTRRIVRHVEHALKADLPGIIHATIRMLADEDWRRLVNRCCNLSISCPSECGKIERVRIDRLDLVDRQRVTPFRIIDLLGLTDVRGEPGLFDGVLRPGKR
jgi:hypothetical protein